MLGLLYLLMGSGLVLVGLRDDVTGTAVVVREPWVGGILVVVGVLGVALGLRLRGGVRRMPRTEADLRRRRVRLKLFGYLNLAAAAILVTAAFIERADGLILVRGWADAVFGVAAGFLVLMGSIWAFFDPPMTRSPTGEYVAAPIETADATDPLAVALLRASGQSGRATVIAVRRQESPGASAPTLLIELELSDGFTTHRVTREERPEPIHAPRLTPGASLPVVFDPADPQKLVIEWDEA